MKKVLFIVAMGFLAISSQAQDIKFGPRIGVNSTTLKVDKNTTGSDLNTQIESGGATLGYQAGLFARLGVAGFYLQPELLFSSSGGSIVVSSTSGGPGGGGAIQTNEYNFKKLDVPVLFGKKFAKVARVNLGPSFSYLLAAESEVGGVTTDVKNNYNNATVGYQVGIGADLGPLVVDLKYEGSLSKFGNEIQAYNTSFNTDSRQSMWVLAVGFSLF